MKNLILELQNLHVAFQATAAVRGINLTLYKGQTTAIVGESGSGKSVTALSIMQLLPPGSHVSGRILFNDFDVLQYNSKQMQSIRGQKIGMIFQEPMTSLNPVFTIGEQISEVVLQHQNVSRRFSIEKTRSILREVGIDPARIDAYPHEFSGGMRQRVMIAIALVNEPDVLIADEPTTALDAITSKQIIQLLHRTIKKRDLSMLFISHDLGIVSAIADDIYVMNSGLIVESGSACNVLTKPQAKYTKALISCRPTLMKKTSRLKTIESI